MRWFVVGAMLGLAIVSGTSPGVAAEITGGLINGAWETGSGGAGPPPAFQTRDQNARRSFPSLMEAPPYCEASTKANTARSVSR